MGLCVRWSLLKTLHVSLETFVAFRLYDSCSSLCFCTFCHKDKDVQPHLIFFIHPLGFGVLLPHNLLINFSRHSAVLFFTSVSLSSGSCSVLVCVSETSSLTNNLSKFYEFNNHVCDR